MADFLAGVVKEAIEGLGKQGRDWIDWWRANRKNEQPVLILDQMLRNPEYRFRDVKTLARAIDDKSEGYCVAVALLKQMGARHNIKPGGSDSWTMGKYWERARDGVWRLKDDVEPGYV